MRFLLYLLTLINHAAIIVWVLDPGKFRRVSRGEFFRHGYPFMLRNRLHKKYHFFDQVDFLIFLPWIPPLLYLSLSYEPGFAAHINWRSTYCTLLHSYDRSPHGPPPSLPPAKVGTTKCNVASLHRQRLANPYRLVAHGMIISCLQWFAQLSTILSYMSLTVWCIELATHFMHQPTPPLPVELYYLVIPTFVQTWFTVAEAYLRQCAYISIVDCRVQRMVVD